MAHVKLIKREERVGANEESEEDVWDGVTFDEKTNSLISDQLNKAIDNITDAIADERAKSRFVSAEEQTEIHDTVAYHIKQYVGDYIQ